MQKRMAIGALCGVAVLANVAKADSVNQSELITGSYVVTGPPADGSATAMADSAADLTSEDLGVFSEWLTKDPFGAGRSVTHVVVQARASSDFGFGRTSVTPVPMPAAVWSGLALMGAMGAVRVRKRMLGV